MGWGLERKGAGSEASPLAPLLPSSRGSWSLSSSLCWAVGRRGAGGPARYVATFSSARRHNPHPRALPPSVFSCLQFYTSETTRILLLWGPHRARDPSASLTCHPFAPYSPSCPHGVSSPGPGWHRHAAARPPPLPLMPPSSLPSHRSLPCLPAGFYTNESKPPCFYL